jgi:hypothetical protein
VIFIESAEILRATQINQDPTARVAISYLIDTNTAATSATALSANLATGK